MLFGQDYFIQILTTETCTQDSRIATVVAASRNCLHPRPYLISTRFNPHSIPSQLTRPSSILLWAGIGSATSMAAGETSWRPAVPPPSSKVTPFPQIADNTQTTAGQHIHWSIAPALHYCKAAPYFDGAGRLGTAITASLHASKITALHQGVASPRNGGSAHPAAGCSIHQPTLDSLGVVVGYATW